MGNDGGGLIHRSKRRRLNAFDDVNRDHNRADDDEDHSINSSTGNQNATTEGESEATDGEGAMEDKAVETVLKKIGRGLNMVVSVEREGRSSQLRAKDTNMVFAQGQHIFTDVIPSDFFAAQGEDTQSRALRLELFLWQQSKKVLRGAKEIAWKSSFLAACVRRNRDATTSIESQSTIRWTTAVWMINLIVDGLWLVWGPKAALVYEALAGTCNHPLF